MSDALNIDRCLQCGRCLYPLRAETGEAMAYWQCRRCGWQGGVGELAWLVTERMERMEIEEAK